MSKLHHILASAALALPLVALPAAARAQEAAEVATGEPAAAGEPAAHGEGHGGHEEVKDPSAHFNFFSFGYGGKDELGGKFGDGVMVDPATGEVERGHDGRPEEEEAMSPPFILMLVNFGLMLFILAKFGGPAARKTAEDRSDQIKTALEEAARLRQEAAAKLADYEARLKDSDAQITKLVADMRADAEAEKARIVAAAEAQAKALQRDAEQRIAAEIELARAALTREVALAATGAAEQLLRGKATGADHGRLVDGFLTDLQAVAARGAQPKEKA